MSTLDERVQFAFVDDDFAFVDGTVARLKETHSALQYRCAVAANQAFDLHRPRLDVAGRFSIASRIKRTKRTWLAILERGRPVRIQQIPLVQDRPRDRVDGREVHGYFSPTSGNDKS